MRAVAEARAWRCRGLVRSGGLRPADSLPTSMFTLRCPTLAAERLMNWTCCSGLHRRRVVAEAAQIHDRLVRHGRKRLRRRG